jgi:hypothetical protein
VGFFRLVQDTESVVVGILQADSVAWPAENAWRSLMWRAGAARGEGARVFWSMLN